MARMRSVLAFLLLGAVALAQEHGTGLKLATPEQLRGIPLAATPFSGAELPRAVDLSENFPPPGFQGAQNSCVGWTLAYALKSYHEHLEEKQPFGDGQGKIYAERVFSPAFIYNQVNGGRDGGCLFQDALRVISEQGAATWADMPYDDKEFRRQPGDDVKTKARKYRIDTWRLVNVKDVKELKAHLNAGYPVAFGAMVDESFAKAGAGFVWNKREGKELGGHAMLLVGYDDDKGAFKVLNSWGGQWCDNGYGWIGYEFFVQVVPEGYVCKDAVNGPPPGPPGPPNPPDVPQPPDYPNPPDFPDPPVPPGPPDVPQPPNVQRQATLSIDNVEHNVQVAPGVNAMRFTGRAHMPAGMGRAAQIVIHFIFDAGYGQRGPPVRGTQPQFADVFGFAACGTVVVQLPPGRDFDPQWEVILPYHALDIPAGQWFQGPFGPYYQPAATAMIAETTLFVDNFGVAYGPPVPFFVQR